MALGLMVILPQVVLAARGPEPGARPAARPSCPRGSSGPSARCRSSASRSASRRRDLRRARRPRDRPANATVRPPHPRRGREPEAAGAQRRGLAVGAAGVVDDLDVARRAGGRALRAGELDHPAPVLRPDPRRRDRRRGPRRAAQPAARGARWHPPRRRLGGDPGLRPTRQRLVHRARPEPPVLHAAAAARLQPDVPTSGGHERPNGGGRTAAARAGARAATALSRSGDPPLALAGARPSPWSASCVVRPDPVDVLAHGRRGAVDDLPVDHAAHRARRASSRLAQAMFAGIGACTTGPAGQQLPRPDPRWRPPLAPPSPDSAAWRRRCPRSGSEGCPSRCSRCAWRCSATRSLSARRGSSGAQRHATSRGRRRSSGSTSRASTRRASSCLVVVVMVAVAGVVQPAAARDHRPRARRGAREPGRRRELGRAGAAR